MAEEDWAKDAGEFLRGAAFRRKRYADSERSRHSDHEHCEFCWATISADPQYENEAYVADLVSLEGSKDFMWVCDECWGKFRERFALREISD